MSTTEMTPRVVWRHSAGRFWGWVMENRDNRIVRQIPNALTVLRLAAIPCGIMSYRSYQTGHLRAATTWVIATILIFGLTDYLDGKSARSLQVVSRFGKLVDPIADKSGVVTMLLLYWWIIRPAGYINDLLQAAALVVILMVILLEACLLLIALENWMRNIVPGANRWGKKKIYAEGATLSAAYGFTYTAAADLIPREAGPIVLCFGGLVIIFLAGLSLEGHLEAQVSSETIPKRP